MSNLARTTEKSALETLSKCLKYFDNLSGKNMTSQDAQEAKKAENIIRGIIENNGYTISYLAGKGTIIFKKPVKASGISLKDFSSRKLNKKDKMLIELGGKNFELFAKYARYVGGYYFIESGGKLLKAKSPDKLKEMFDKSEAIIQSKI